MKKLLYYALSTMLIAGMIKTNQIEASQKTESGSWVDLLTQLAGNLSTGNKSNENQSLGSNTGSGVVSNITQLSDKISNLANGIENLRNIDPSTKNQIVQAVSSLVPELAAIKNQILQLNPTLKNANTSDSSLGDFVGKAIGTLFGSDSTTSQSGAQRQTGTNQAGQEGSFLGKVLQQLGELNK